MCLPSSLPKGPIQAIFQPGFQAGIDHQFTPFKTLYANGSEVENTGGEKLNSNTTQLHLHYNIDPKFGFQVSIPYHNRSYTRLGASGKESGTVSGIGDIIVRGRYAPITRFGEKHTLIWTVDAGLKLPTGDSSLLRGHSHGSSDSIAPAAAHETEEHTGEGHGEEAHTNEDGHHGRLYLAHNGVDHGAGGEETEAPVAHVSAAPVDLGAVSHAHHGAIEDHDLALGSGSVDGIIGTGVLYRTGSLYASAGTQYVLRSTGTGGYRYGDLWTWRVAPGYLVVNTESQVVGLQVNISGEHHDPNTVYGQPDHGYTDIIFAGPEVVSQGENLSLAAGVDFPVKYRSEGLTLAPDYRARFHFNWRF